MSAKSTPAKTTAAKTTAAKTTAAKTTARRAAKAVAKPAAATRTSNNPSKLFAAGSKTQAGPLTSEAIAMDLAAFKKAGGRIEVLGNTPMRTTSTSFRSAGNAARTAPATAPATAGSAAKTRS